MATTSCLDGARLILTQGNGGNASVYRTERDTFAKITKYDTNGAPDHFEVRYKNGQIATLGGSNATVVRGVLGVRVVSATGAPDRAGGDSQGNTIDYTYADPHERDGNLEPPHRRDSKIYRLGKHSGKPIRKVRLGRQRSDSTRSASTSAAVRSEAFGSFMRSRCTGPRLTRPRPRPRSATGSYAATSSRMGRAMPMTGAS